MLFARTEVWGSSFSLIVFFLFSSGLGRQKWAERATWRFWVTLCSLVELTCPVLVCGTYPLPRIPVSAQIVRLWVRFWAGGFGNQFHPFPTSSQHFFEQIWGSKKDKTQQKPLHHFQKSSTITAEQSELKPKHSEIILGIMGPYIKLGQG